MYQNKSVAVVIPAYNEEGFVGEVIRTIPDFVDRVYAVDDQSIDGTWAEIRQQVSRLARTHEYNKHGTLPIDPNAEVVSAELPSKGDHSVSTDGGEQVAEENSELAQKTGLERRVYGIRHAENKGVGGSIVTGYRCALADEIDVTAVMNGDGQMRPQDLPEIIGPVIDGSAEYAKGNRLLKAADRRGMSQWRFLGNSILTFLTKIASGYWKVHDPQNGYTAISRQALEELDLDRLYERYGFCNDMLIQLNVKEFRVADIAMPAVYGDERSGIRYSSFVPELSFLLLTRFLWRLKNKYLIRDFHPLVFFYLLGGAGMVQGMFIGGWALTAADSPGVLFAVAAILLTLSSALICLGMTFDMWHNEPLERRYYD